jgi:hypothetical protein
MEERTEDRMLLSTNEIGCQGSTIYRRTMFDLHRLVKNLPLNKMSENGGTKHTGVPVKTLKKLLKKAGLKVSGKKATLTRRAKKARLLKGGLGGIGAIKGLPAAVLSPEQQKQKDELLKGKAEFEAATAKTIANAAATKQQRELDHKAERDESYARAAQIPIAKKQGFVSNLFQGTIGGKKKRSRRS